MIDLSKIPSKWRFYTADCSRRDTCTVRLVRSGTTYAQWFHLSKEQADAVGLYATGTGTSFEKALTQAIAMATPFPQFWEV